MIDTAEPWSLSAACLDRAVHRLAAIPPLEYDQIRKAEAQRLGVRSATLDAEVAKKRPSETAISIGQGRPLDLPEPEPWDDPVDGAELLDALVATLRQYVVLPDHAAEALALWVLQAHCLDVSDINPRLVIMSPQMRCGKTTLLIVIHKLVPRPLLAANITPAAVFRAINACEPTLLIDEADTFLGDNLEMRGVVNSGHTRAAAFIIRNVGDDHEPRTFSTWCPMVVAAIGKVWGTLADRSIIVPMRRKKPNESVKRLRMGRNDGLNQLARQAARWSEDHATELRRADPNMPGALNDRAADNWRPLIAIAEAAGGDWPDKAHRAALTLASEQDDETADVLLLCDVRMIFDNLGVDRLSSHDLVAALVALENRPWSEWRKGKPLSTNALARLLRPFSITPGSIRLGPGTKDTPKGYKRHQFEDTWSRYSPIPPS